MRYCRRLLQDVLDAMPTHLEQEGQALLDSIRGTDTALLWLGAEQKRLARRVEAKVRRVTREGSTSQATVKEHRIASGDHVIKIRVENLHFEGTVRIDDFHIGVERLR